MSEQEVKELDLNGEMLVRREKLAALRAKGNAFQTSFVVMCSHKIYTINMIQKTGNLKGKALKYKLLVAL